MRPPSIPVRSPLLDGVQPKTQMRALVLDDQASLADQLSSALALVGGVWAVCKLLAAATEDPTATAIEALMGQLELAQTILGRVIDAEESRHV